MTDSTTTAPSTPQQPLKPQPTNGLAVASLVVGVIAFTSGWIPFWGFLSGVAAIILGILSLKKINGKGMAVAGIATGAIAALVSLLISVFFIIALVTNGGLFEEDFENNQSQTQEDRQMLNAQKNFEKGDTALLGLLEVKVNSVQRNYVPENTDDVPAEGKEFILVHLTVKNTGEKSVWVGQSTFKVDDGTNISGSALTPFDSRFQNNYLTTGETDSGDVIYEVTKDTSDLTLQYNTGVRGDGGPYQKLIYTLDI